jgi:hypothetical protein
MNKTRGRAGGEREPSVAGRVQADGGSMPQVSRGMAELTRSGDKDEALSVLSSSSSSNSTPPWPEQAGSARLRRWRARPELASSLLAARHGRAGHRPDRRRPSPMTAQQWPDRRHGRSSLQHPRRELVRKEVACRRLSP